MRKTILKLYVLGRTPNSVRAIETVRALCEEELRGRCALEVIDVAADPAAAEAAGIIATPTLMRHKPTPPRRIIGDLTDRQKLLDALEIALN